MNIKKIKEKQEQLIKIYKIIESRKNITLVNILKLSKIVSFYLDRTNLSKVIIEEFLKKFNIINSTLDKKNSILNFKSKTNLWVYVTEEEKYSTNSYKKHEDTIIEKANIERDKFIVIGQRAVNFAEDQKLHVIYQEKENNVATLSKILPKLIINTFKNNEVNQLNVVINSSKISHKYIKLLPIKENNFEFKYHTKSSLKIDNLTSYKIYPNLDNFVESELENYLTFAIVSLLMESSLVKEKYNLVVQNKTLNDLEEKIAKQKRIYLRFKKDLEIEEISILSRKKDLLHFSKEGKN
ncbi:MSC_0622 family F1-like ATPase gamma subunit [Mycoplasmopsis columbina]|uniref:MSC_0622 family F1-like ATPase gamma subunit n=1 Tax=Mycoplasmopsis columbina TaxID=114881 RepID=UPI0004A6CABC|nr:hypothetical protein [Mycoplasmopsis columbina]VEU76660.1 Uncharacterised protein [Mycoplasmopsis columbina]